MNSNSTKQIASDTSVFINHSANNRLLALDIAKGIGILLVVIGHSQLMTINNSWFGVIYSFHMPLFFFLSGVLFKFEPEFGVFCKKKSAQLLKPFYSVILTLGGLKVALGDDSIAHGLIGIAWGTGNTIPLVSLWFLPHLWFVFVFAWAVESTMRLSAKGRVAKVLMLSTFLFFGYMLTTYFRSRTIAIPLSDLHIDNAGLPFSIDLVFLSGFYFLLGNICRSHIFLEAFKVLNLVIASILFIGLNYYVEAAINMNQRVYSNPILSTVIALSGIIITLELSKLLSKFKLSTLIATLGQRSLFILLFHGSIQSIIFGIASKELNTISSILIAFFCSIIGSLSLEWVVRKSRFLSIFFFPIDKKLSSR